MKKLLLFIISFLIAPLIFSQQYYYTFSELKGMEDNSGNTHLFYRLYYYQKGGEIIGDYRENSIYHYDIQNDEDSLFLFDGGRVFESTKTITDYEFWNNEPTKFIYGGYYVSVDPTAFIIRFDKDEELITLFGSDDCNIELSDQNDSLIFAAINRYTLKSIDKGETWDTIPSMFGKEIISLNPLNDSIIFVQSENQLLKSIDSGNNFSVADTFQTDIKQFFYDKDENHIYRIINNGGENFLSVSNNKGNAFSWKQKYSSPNKILISVDYSQSGSIYLADRNYIYFSNDYGNNFSFFKKLDRRVIGIYKKPSSLGGPDKLYVATKYDLYEISADTIVTLKHLQLDPNIFNWFPLHVGDKWLYNTTFTSESEAIKSVSTKTVVDKISFNDKTYFVLAGSVNYRVDSTTGKIYKAYFDSDTLTNEELYLDLTAEVGDTLKVGNGIYLASVTQFSDFGINSIQKNFMGISTPYKDLRIVRSLGIVYDLTWELVGFEYQLKGAVINGVVYGDTTLTDVEKTKNIPTSFLLSQNYPNPFNPSTIISWQLPVRSKVTLKVYDILGNEIAVIVNEEKGAGSYQVEFDAENLASGIYFYKLSAAGGAGNFYQTKKMILLR